MDAKYIIDRINNSALLKTDKPENWKSITEKHPYFSVGQLLQYGNDYFHEQQNIEYAALYKSDPILFANYVKSLSSVPTMPDKEVISEAKEIDSLNESLVTDSKEFDENEVITELKEEPKISEVVEIIASKELVDSDLKNNIITNAKEELTNNESITNEVEPPLSIKFTPTENKTETSEKKEDILALINELPNNNIVEEKIYTSTKEEKAMEFETAEERRDKALMIMMSFTDWLNHFKIKTENEQIEEQEKKALKTAWQKEKLTAIIEEEQDEIPELIFKQAMDSISVENALISESLAEILAKQGKTDKAIDMYKKLSLRNPEKNSYFADRIKDLLTNNI